MNANASTTKMTEIVVREITEQKELRAVEELQKEVWGLPDLDVVPYTQIIAAKTVGGVLLGAFDGKDLVGFVYGFVGYEHGQVSHHSHMLAVKPEYRNFDLARRLKLAQRERVLEQGIKFMSWTFDPLQSLNAYINFSKLGVYSNRYFINFYGEEATSFLHQTGTDRLLVTWDLSNTNLEERLDYKIFKKTFGRTIPLIKVSVDEYPLIGDLEEGLKEETALIEIPANINDLVQNNGKLATKWRERTRQAFTKAIDAGFTIENFYRTERGDQKLGVYLLVRENKGIR